jgi:uncharacterized repeat protein (TIGR01451 family)
MCNAGRADFSVPVGRQDAQFFDIMLWQTPSPGSPNEGNFSSTQMTFFDGVGPGSSDIVVGGYHWPKGVQGMDRHTGLVRWYGNPEGGESIGGIASAFSNNGHTIYVTNDATSHPTMAFATTTGPSSYWSNASDPNPGQLGMGSPKIAPDGRIFLHAWGDRPYGGTDNGSSILTTWVAATSTTACLADPVLYNDSGQLKVVAGGRNGVVYCYDGATGAELWAVPTGQMIDTNPTINPSNGNIYVGAGGDSVYVIGLTKDGAPLWGTAAKLVYQYQNGVNNPQCARGAGCLSFDGNTYYFQTNSQQGDGRLYAIDTLGGGVKWSYATGSTGWEIISAAPIVTQNGIIIVGNNQSTTPAYFAIRDDTTQGTLIDTLQVDAGGSARASASLGPDGSLYLPIRVIWTTPNGSGGTPTFQVANVFSCIDLSAGATVKLSPPPGQGAIALNHAVQVYWTPITDSTGQFHHYAVYRATAPFTSVSGKTPIATVTGIGSSGYLDNTAVNGTHYYYAVTSVTVSGGEIKTINSIGPFTPRDETDLQILSVGRTPRYPRYWAEYTYYSITEPSGFGPYIFSSSTSLGGGQTFGTKRWPNVGETVTYTATVRNRGTNPWITSITATWKVDGGVVSNPSKSVTLNPGQTTTFTYQMTWDGASHDIGFTINVSDARSSNNSLTTNSKSVAFLTYVDTSYIEKFRELSVNWPQHKTDDIFDWLNSHMPRFNQMFADANCLKRVHYGILLPLNDSDPDPNIDTISFAIFPFRYHATDGDARGSGYYSQADDIDYGLLHEEAHQLGLIDIYQFDIGADGNQVSGQGYSAVASLMHGCSPFLSEFDKWAMTDWLDKAHGYYGQFMYNLPQTIRVRFLGYNGQPLQGATVKMYQVCERPGIGKLITTQIKAQGTTDSNGYYVLPNVPIDRSKVPVIGTGDTLNANPFGYLAVVGTNGVLHFRVEVNGGVDYCWLDVTECMVAYFQGQTTTATFDRQLGLGGPIQFYPVNDMAELNANDWSAWAQGSSGGNTYVVDDTVRRIVGSGSVNFVTLDGGFDTYSSHPKNETAQWDLRLATTLRINVYAINTTIGFQEGSPWIRLKDSNGNYYQYQYYLNGGPYDLLNEARNQWRQYNIPIYASDSENNGWRRTAFGTPDIAHINRLEFHADTWDYGFKYWLDGVTILFSGGAPVTSIRNAKGAPDNTRVDLTGAIVSAAWPNVFYIETLSRSSGIRVEKAGHTLVAGQTVRIFGFVKTNADGERTIDASWAQWDTGSGTAPPLLMTTRSIGGGSFNYNQSTGAGQKGVLGGTGLNNIGLLVRIGGKVVERDSSPGPTWFKIGDGSSTNVKVIVPSGGTVPALNTFQKVNGASSCYKVGSDLYPQILGTQIVPQ